MVCPGVQYRLRGRELEAMTYTLQLQATRPTYLYSLGYCWPTVKLLHPQTASENSQGKAATAIKGIISPIKVNELYEVTRYTQTKETLSSSSVCTSGQKVTLESPRTEVPRGTLSVGVVMIDVLKPCEIELWLLLLWVEPVTLPGAICKPLLQVQEVG